MDFGDILNQWDELCALGDAKLLGKRRLDLSNYREGINGFCEERSIHAGSI